MLEISWASCARAAYQRVENPPQTVTRREALKLKITSRRIGP
jgi:hypothetical protein